MPYRLIDKRTIFNGKKVHLEMHHLQDEDGRVTHREVVVHPGAVVILPFLPDGRIILIRNVRHTVGAVLTELPAGTLEMDEVPMNCAGRELQEETGYLAGRLTHIASFFSSPGILTEKLHAFAAYDLQKTAAALDEGEEIEVLPVQYSEALDMIGTGEIADAKTIATLLMFDRFHRAKP